MKFRLLDNESEKTFVLVFDPEEEVVAVLKKFAQDNELTAAYFTAIGAFKELQLGYFDSTKKEYEKIPITEQVEVLSLIGNIVTNNGEPQVHAHVVVGKRDGTAHGGHLLKGYVRPTLEIMLVETPVYLQRKRDEQSGLALIDLDAETLPPRRGRKPSESTPGR